MRVVPIPPCAIRGSGQESERWSDLQCPRERTFWQQSAAFRSLQRGDTKARFLRLLWVMRTHGFAFVALMSLALVTTAGTAATFEGRAWGDIHVQTIDGATYEFQSTGEFVASRSTARDLEVQLRLESRGFSPNVSVATAVALLVDTTRASVTLGRKPLLYIDGQPAPLPVGFVELPDGGRIERSKRGYEIFWADGSTLSIDVRKRFLNAYLRPAETRRSTLSGLFGNFNGNAVDDVDATVAALGAASQSQVNSTLAELARTLLADGDDPALLAQEESIFEYEPGQSTYSFRRPKSTREATPEALTAGWRKKAKEACEGAGVTAPDLLKACIVDVGYTHDESFAETAASVQARDMTNWDSDLANRADADF